MDEPILEISSYSVETENVDRNLLINLIDLGWSKAIRILMLILQFVTKCRHSSRRGLDCSGKKDCIECNYKINTVERTDKYRMEIEQYIFRKESEIIRKVYTEKEKTKLKLKDGIYYYISRLTEDQPFRFEDLEDGLQFFDGLEISGILPVVLIDYPIFQAYLLHVHLRLQPHAGVELTIREIGKKMMVRDGLRRIVRKLRKDCSRCRIILLKTIELEMSRHTAARTIISPPFFHCMIDIAYGFPGQPYKNARKTTKLYALVIVCLLTSATNILVLEGVETQDVCAALERHSCRYGIPACIFIDQGTQLKAMEHAKFSSRSLETMLVNKLEIRVVVSKAKAHNERGRVESKIKITRVTLEQLGENAKHPQTAVQWETLFSKVANCIDNTPIAKGNSTNAIDIGFEILTANRIKMGRNNFRSLHGSGVDLEMSANLSRLLERNKEMYRLWYSTYIDNIHLFALKPSKWPRSDTLPLLGDVVLFVYKEDPTYNKRNADWKLGRVVRVEERMIAVEFVAGTKKNGEVIKNVLERNPRDVCILLGAEELAINSSLYFSRLLTSQTRDGEDSDQE